MESMTLQEVVVKAQAGEEAAWDELYRRKARAILYTCTMVMGNKVDGEDAAGEVLLRLHTSLPRLQDPLRFDAWLNSLVHNTCVDMKRRFYRKQRLDLPGELLESPGQMEEGFLPQHTLERQEERAMVIKAMKRLPDRYREALLLFYFESMSQKQIAQIMGKTEDAVEHMLRRARAALRHQLEKDGIIRPGDTHRPAVGGVPVLAAILKLDAAGQPARPVERLIAMARAGGRAAGGITLGAKACTGLRMAVAAITTGAVVAAAVTVATPPAPRIPVDQAGVAIKGAAGTVKGEAPLPDSGGLPDEVQGGGWGDGAVAPGTGGGQAPPNVVPEPEKSGPEPPWQPLVGKLVFVDSMGTPLEDQYMEGFTVTLVCGGQVLASARVSKDGAYTLVAGKDMPALAGALKCGEWTLLAKRHSARDPTFTGATPMGAVKVGDEVAQGGVLPDIYVTDALPPGVVITLEHADGSTGGSFGAFGLARATITDETSTQSVWQILAEDGEVVDEGVGDLAPLEHIPAGPRGTRYTIVFWVTDAAGNRTEARRDLMLFQ